MSLSNSFVRSYRCFSVTSLNRPQLENGDKIIMPSSALYTLASMRIDYPMLFELSTEDCVSHCGVLEFVAEEGMVYMPEWMMRNMNVVEGQVLKVKNVGLPKGTFIKLQPHSVDFLDLTDPKAVLENSLRRFTCLTSGDTFMVFYNEKKYFVDVLETKPGNAVSVVETDCEVDFAPPLDYIEPEIKKEVEDVKDFESAQVDSVEFRSFTGTGRTLDGKVVEVPVISRTCVEYKAGVNSLTGGGSSERHAQGRVVFGGKNNGKDVEEEARKLKTEKKEEPKFQPFSGRGYSLQ